MVEMLRPNLDRRGQRGGQCKLSVEDQLLLVVEYWREDRTQFQIATSWGLSESAVCRLIQKVETLLMKSGKFRVPGKKQLYQNAYQWDVVVVDVTESPIERPKKNSAATTVLRKSNIPSKHKSWLTKLTDKSLALLSRKGESMIFDCSSPIAFPYCQSNCAWLTKAIGELLNCMLTGVFPLRNRARAS